MSIFKRSTLCRSIFVLLVFMFSVNCFSSGVAERKHESKQHISSKGEMYEYQLSLDDVLPSSKSILIAPSSERVKPKLAPILIRVTGYSGYETAADAKSEPKRLLAMRASKLDAYRALAERVYGLSVSGKSNVEDFVLKEDHFAVALNSHVRGARVVSVNEKKGVGFETVLELMLPGDFDDCVNKVNSFKNGLNCLRPLPSNTVFMDQENTRSQSNNSRQATGRNRNSGYFLN